MSGLKMLWPYGRAGIFAFPICTILLTATHVALAGPWSAAQTLNPSADWNNGQYQLKSPQVEPASGGGFHVSYVGGNGLVRYRRVNIDMSLGVALEAYNPVGISPAPFSANSDVVEANDGSVYVTWERWHEPSSGSGPEVGIRQIAANGTFLTGPQTISSTGGKIKFPLVSAVGNGSGNSQVLVSYYDESTSPQPLRSRIGSGTTWGSVATYATSTLGTGAGPEQAVWGHATSPVDGSVWRAWATGSSGTYSLKMTRLDPTTLTWGSPVDVVTGKSGYISRMSMAINKDGQVMLAWDSANSTTGRIYTPGANNTAGTFNAEMSLWGNQSFFGNVAAVPGTNNFYVFNAYGTDFPMVRPIINGVLDPVAYPAEYPADPVNNIFIPWVRGAVDENGRMIAVWENWNKATGTNPTINYSVRDAIPIPEPASLLPSAALGGVALLARRKTRRRRFGLGLATSVASSPRATAPRITPSYSPTH